MAGQISPTAVGPIQRRRIHTHQEEILRMLANGRTSKEIAILLDVSLSYVYNIRTGLRKKFQLSESEDLDAWIVDQARILGRSNPN